MYDIPPLLHSNIQSLLKGIPLKTLQKGYENLKKAYLPLKSGENKASHTHLLTSKEDKLAYITSRMPATFAALCFVFNIFKQGLADKEEVFTLLDMGSGPGTTLWAFHEIFNYFPHSLLLEKDKEMVSFSKKLFPLEVPFTYQSENIFLSSFSTSYDLSILSYVLGEISLKDQESLLEKTWNTTSKWILLLEPGTPQGFERIKAARSFFIEKGGVITAPCPHQQSCPIPEGDFCHFSQRFNRTKEHLFIKEGERGFEDEKFSFLIVSKEKINVPQGNSRILRHPFIHKGHIDFVICKEGKMEPLKITKKQDLLYKEAKKWKWGDLIRPLSKDV